MGSISVAWLFGLRKREGGGTLLSEALENVCAFSVIAIGVHVYEREAGPVEASCLVYCTFLLS